jgi:methylmalonyl-CoA mutase
VSSYQGGHIEYFRYLVDRLRELGAPDVRVYGGGGGTITPAEADALHAYGVARIFGPDDGRALGLEGMIQTIVDECSAPTRAGITDELERLSPEDPVAVTRLITWLESEGSGDGADVEALRARLASIRERPAAPVVGFTGTGGAGKSSVVDELIGRYRLEFPEHSVGVLLVDPTRRRTGGALLGDRIRMNMIDGPRSSCARWRRAGPTSRCRAPWRMRCGCCRPPTTTSCSSRRRASDRATPRSSTSWTCRST